MQIYSSVVVSLSLLVAIVTSHPAKTECSQERPLVFLNTLSRMSERATDLFSQSAGNTHLQIHGGNVVMSLSGFTSVITIDNNEDLEPPEYKPKEEARLIELGYEYLNGHYYKFHEKGVDWWTAKKSCEKEDGYLVIINSEDEAQLVSEIFNEKITILTEYPDQMFVGLNDLEEEGVFVTIFGDSITTTGYERWEPKNPSNSKDKNEDGENCVAVKVNKELNDIHCNALLSYMCEATVNS